MSSSISSSRMALCITYLSKEGSDAHLEGLDSGDTRKSMEDSKLGYITDLLDLQPAYIGVIIQSLSTMDIPVSLLGGTFVRIMTLFCDFRHFHQTI